MQEEYKYRDITEKIIGCGMNVHRFLGPGFPEIVYERSLLIELQSCGLVCESQVEMDIYFRGSWVGKRRLDLLVERKFLLNSKQFQ